jgi:hypothetical protein
MRAIILLTAIAAVALVALSLPAETTETTPAAATAPATRPADVTDEATADAVIRALLEARVKRPLLPRAVSTAPSSQPATVAPKSIIRPLPMPPGAMIVDRVGRLVREEGGGWWALHFESEKKVLYEAPIRLLPNRLLEEMEQAQAKGAKAGVKFIVSGEVTEYRGRRYLLIRKMLIKRNFGTL